MKVSQPVVSCAPLVEWSPEVQKRTADGMAYLRSLIAATGDAQLADLHEAIADNLRVLVDQRAVVRACPPG